MAADVRTSRAVFFFVVFERRNDQAYNKVAGRWFFSLSFNKKEALSGNHIYTNDTTPSVLKFFFSGAWDSPSRYITLVLRS